MLAQRGDFAGWARLSLRRVKARGHLLGEQEGEPPDNIATGQPANSASAAPRVAEANRQVRVTRSLVMGHPVGIRPGVCAKGYFQFINREKLGKLLAPRPSSGRSLPFAGPLDLLTRSARWKLTPRKARKTEHLRLCLQFEGAHRLR